MENTRQTDGRRNAKGLFIVIAALVVSAALTKTVAAQFTSRIGGLFRSYATSTGPTILDFLVFFIIFFALCWIGFKQVFKEAKNANIALAATVGLALAVGLVYGGQFTLKKLLPFAAVILLLVVVIGIYVLLRKFLFKKDTIVSKILAFITALAVAGLLLFFLSSLICSNNRCNTSPFLNKFFGKGSFLGSIGAGIKDVTGTPAVESGVPAAQRTFGGCGDGRVVSPEKCDPKAPNQGCPKGQLCDKGCTDCIPQGRLEDAGDIAESVGGWFSNNWLILVIILGLTVPGMILIKRSKRIGRWRKKRNAVDRLRGVLNIVDDTEQMLRADLGQVKRDVSEEHKTLAQAKTAVDSITAQIKETIGENMELIVNGGDQGLDRQLSTLHALNNNEKHITKELILPKITDALNDIKHETDLHKNLEEDLKAIGPLQDHFEKETELLEQLKRYDAREKGILDSIIADFTSQSDSLRKFAERCESMLQTVEAEQEIINQGRAWSNNHGDVTYEKTVNALKELQLNMLKLKNVFAQKLQLLRHILLKFSELKAEVIKLHNSEIAHLADVLNSAKNEMGDRRRRYDHAVYLASLVADNAKLLKHAEMSDEDMDRLKSLETEAESVIASCMANFHQFASKIEHEIIDAINSAQSDVHPDDLEEVVNRARKFALHLSHFDFVNKEYKAKYNKDINECKATMEKVLDICDTLEENFRMIHKAAHSDELSADLKRDLEKSVTELGKKISVARELARAGVFSALHDKIEERKAYTQVIIFIFDAEKAKAEGNNEELAKITEQVKLLLSPDRGKSVIPRQLLTRFKDVFGSTPQQASGQNDSQGNIEAQLKRLFNEEPILCSDLEGNLRTLILIGEQAPGSFNHEMRNCEALIRSILESAREPQSRYLLKEAIKAYLEEQRNRFTDLAHEVDAFKPHVFIFLRKLEELKEMPELK